MPSAFLATVEFIVEYSEPDRFKYFTKIRKPFEDFLVERKDFFRQIVIKTRGGMKAVRKIKAFFEFLIIQCEINASSEQILKALQASPEFNFLKLPSPPEAGVDLSPAVKSKVTIRDKLASAVRCSICGARVPDQGISYDHTQDKKAGGLGNEGNIAATHHYCNSAKDMLIPYLTAERTGIEPASA